MERGCGRSLHWPWGVELPDLTLKPGGGSGLTAHPASSCHLCQDLMQYCAQDVWATYEVFQQQLPLFMER